MSRGSRFLQCPIGFCFLERVLADREPETGSGEVTEWPIVLAWKASERVKPFRGFESHPLRQFFRARKNEWYLQEPVTEVDAHAVASQHGFAQER